MAKGYCPLVDGVLPVFIQQQLLKPGKESEPEEKKSASNELPYYSFPYKFLEVPHFNFLFGRALIIQFRNL